MGLNPWDKPRREVPLQAVEGPRHVRGNESGTAEVRAFVSHGETKALFAAKKKFEI